MPRVKDDNGGRTVMTPFRCYPERDARGEEGAYGCLWARALLKRALPPGRLPR